MSTLLRWIGALLTVACLLCAALLGLGWYATTGFYMDRALGDDALLQRQQARIDTEVATLAQQWHVSPGTLAPWTQDAVQSHRETLSAWWDNLWHALDASPSLPVFLSASDERELVAAIMADEAFIAATASSMRRTTARDDVAYALDEAVCQAVLPLRRSVIDVGLSFAATSIDLPSLARLVGYGAIGLAVLGGVLLLTVRRAAGSVLMATGWVMGLCSVPVWLLNIPNMLGQLNALAASQGACSLLWLALPWYGAALMLAVAGHLIIRARY